MAVEGLTRRRVLKTAALPAGWLAAPFVRQAAAAVGPVPTGEMTLAWHTNIAPTWLDPQQHVGGATPDNFLNVAQDALIKNAYVFPSAITTGYPYPWEDSQLKA